MNMNDKLTLQPSKLYKFPFYEIRIGGKKTKTCMITAPLYSDQFHIFKALKSEGYLMIGISSFGNYPFMHETDMNNNDRSAMLKRDDHQSLMKQIDCWLTCSRKPVLYDVPQLLFSESDCHFNPETLKPKGLTKKQDILYIAGSDLHFHQYHKNWKLAQDCFQKMSAAGMSALVIGRNAPEGFDLPGISYKPFLNWFEILDIMEESRVLFVPNLSDASPRVITESLCKGTPILVNKHIFGGWKYVNALTGSFFESQDDVMSSLTHVLNSTYDTRSWFLDSYYPNGESIKLKELKNLIASLCNGTIPLEENSTVIVDYSYTRDIPFIDMKANDVKFIYVSIDTDDNITLWRNDLTTYVDKITATFTTNLKPHHWVIWPFHHAKGWGDKQDFDLNFHLETNHPTKAE